MDLSGIVILSSPYTVKETADHLQTWLGQHGATIYVRIDQQDELRKAGLSSQPLEFILFGNPRAGGPIMQENPLAALDLPLKVIVWEDKAKKVWAGFNDPKYIIHRYGLSEAVSKPLDIAQLISGALGG
jgi:uncharacterized protein (DUF302 family)